MTNYKECPFCGKKVASWDNCRGLEMCVGFEECDEDILSVSLVCNMSAGGCGASTGFRPTKNEAIAAWNKRDIKQYCNQCDAVKALVDWRDDAKAQIEILQSKLAAKDRQLENSTALVDSLCQQKVEVFREKNAVIARLKRQLQVAAETKFEEADVNNYCQTCFGGKKCDGTKEYCVTHWLHELS